ncbi:MAG: hypothetical protein ACRELA_11700, partial [Candidatus Rokuibacteriota bacterium]
MSPGHARTLAVCVSLLAVVGLGAAALAASAFDGVRALRDVERLVAFGPRPPGSAALGRARAYL